MMIKDGQLAFRPSRNNLFADIHWRPNQDTAAAWILMPPDVAEHLAGQSGSPDPNEPPVVAPFNIEIVSGDEEALQRV